MTELPPTHSEHVPSTEAQVSHGVGRLLLLWLHETLVNWAVVAALVAGLSGFAVGAGLGWRAGGVAICLAGLLLASVAARRWSPPWSRVAPVVALVSAVAFTVAVVRWA